jgi:hypothetical protein
LNASTGLVGPVVARRRGAAARLHLARWMATPGRAVGGDHALTPEQVSAFQAGRVVRLQARRALQGLRTAPVTVTCRLCGTPFLARASAHRVLCDDLACARLARRLRRRRDGPRGADTPAEVLAR